MLENKQIVLVAAMAANRVIGSGNDIPWKIPGEQKRFRELTVHQLVVMGRRTYESIGKPLPDRDIVVIGTQARDLPGVRCVASFAEASAVIAADPRPQALIAGGQQIYAMFMPYADLVHLTEIDLQVGGDAHFPALPADFVLTDSVEISGATPYRYRTYTRLKSIASNPA
jgi:dihydrofolate reductase